MFGIFSKTWTIICYSEFSFSGSWRQDPSIDDSNSGWSQEIYAAWARRFFRGIFQQCIRHSRRKEGASNSQQDF